MEATPYLAALRLLEAAQEAGIAQRQAPARLVEMAVLAAVVAVGATLQEATAILHPQVLRKGQTGPHRLRQTWVAQDEAAVVAAQVLRAQPETHRATEAQGLHLLFLAVLLLMPVAAVAVRMTERRDRAALAVGEMAAVKMLLEAQAQLIPAVAVAVEVSTLLVLMVLQAALAAPASLSSR